ncbi:thrombospondin type-1 domain-containing protein 4-like [Phoca vitulina]|uniref:thrombospondin type-1 domain-containing protein 4-like n=1 Tax=Phoca vitulina TaxID=9720 RepID=UPI0013960C40|nr:thrombospondin type-1 domain-containing protein 4-like [Phoca vitulina]
MGRFYEWEPFAEVKGNRKCELNCQAMGYRFYVRQAEKVIDGTPCDQNGTAICVSGQCKVSALDWVSVARSLGDRSRTAHSIVFSQAMASYLPTAHGAPKHELWASGLK